MALDESKEFDSCRYAQAAHKLGESLSVFESVRFWYLWPNVPQTHSGARWLLEAIKQYKSLSPEDIAAKQLGRAGLGNAQMNLGQLYRRTAAYTPRLRLGLAKKAREIISESIEVLRDKEKDLRALPMAVAASAADDPSKTLTEKIEAVNLAIEYSEEWNQDAIQIGSAYFMKAQLLARADPLTSESCYLEALSAFRDAEMRAEISRTELELAALETQLATQSIFGTEGSAEWKFGSRMLGLVKVLFRLAPVETILAIIATLSLFIIVILNAFL